MPGSQKPIWEEKMRIEKILEKYAIKAGLCAQRMQKRGLKRTDKGGGDFATAADYRSEEILLKGFMRELPGIPVVSEEQKLPTIVPRTCIVCDPIDGTIIYAHGCHNWGVSICYIEDGVPAAGVIYAPGLKTTVVARRNGGCKLNGKKVRLIPPKRDERYLVAFDICHATEVRYLDKIVKPLMERSLVIRSLGTSVGSTIELLEGGVSAYVAPKGGKVWDFAASVLAVEEAGGAARAPDGGSIKWNRIPVGVVLAADGRLCAEMVGITKRAV